MQGTASPKKGGGHSRSPASGKGKNGKSLSTGRTSSEKGKLPGVGGALQPWEGKGKDRIIGRSRDLFTQILKERGEFHKFSKWNKKVPGVGVFSLSKVILLLEKYPEERTIDDLMMIAEELRQTKVFEQLKISPDMEIELAKIAQVRHYYMSGGIVVREEQPCDSFYCILEGCCVFQKAAPIEDTDATLPPSTSTTTSTSGKSRTPAHGQFVLIANIVEALGIPAADATGTSDAFCTIQVGTQQAQTGVCRETLNPIWETTLRLDIPPDADVVEVQVWDNDAWGDNDFLGMVSVPLSSLKVKMHKFNAYSVKLQSDPRYEVAADEGGVNLEVCGTITFHLKLTTATALENAEKLSALSAAADVFASGDSFGVEELKDGKPYPYTVMVEQASVMLKVLRVDYLAAIHPLQDKERQRKANFLSPMMPFAAWKKERIEHVCDWLQVAKYRPGEEITQEGSTDKRVLFMLSGQAKVTKRVWKSVEEMHEAYSAVADGMSMMRFDEASPSEAFMEQYMNHANDTKHPFDGVLTSDMGWINPGMTINLNEVIHRKPCTYSAVSVTPVEVLTSSGGSLIDLSANWREPTGLYRKEEEGSTYDDIGIIMALEDLTPLVEQAPNFPHALDLSTQWSERQDWQKYKQTLVSNIIYNKRRQRDVNASGRVKFDYSNLLGSFTAEPSLPPILKPLTRFASKDIKRLEKKGSRFDPDEGAVVTFKERLHNAASPTAKVYTYDPPLFRPPSSYGSYEVKPKRVYGIEAAP